MNCEHTRAVLCGDAPWIDVGSHIDGCDDCRALADELGELDTLAAALSPLVAPPELVDRTREAMRDLIQGERVVPISSRRRRWWVGGTITLTAAAALLLTVLPGPSTPDTSQMVERGLGERLPEVALRVAVDHGGEVSRLSQAVDYQPGDQLFFRASLDAEAELALVRVDRAGARIVHRQPAAAGDVDLSLGSAPLAWRVEPGEHDAVFALLAANSPLDEAAVVDALGRAYDPRDAQAVCSAALTLGTRCAAAAIRIAGDDR